MPAPIVDDAQRSRLSVLPAALRRAERPWIAIPVAAAISLGGSALLALVLQMLFPGVEEPVFAMSGWAAFIAVVLLAPFIETLIMAAVLEVLLRFVRPATAVTISAVGWAIAHSMQAAAWGLIIWWPFLIFSSMYVVWRRRGIATAVVVVTAIHMLQNFFPALQLLHS